MTARRNERVLWTAADAAAATGGACAGNWGARAVSIDSRAIRGGELFVALKGERFDGHAFAADALAAGAVAVMLSDVPAALAGDPRVLAVDDTLAGLHALAAAARARAVARVVAVTGSVGKTGTKDALRLALAASGPTHATRGNLNNQIGLPLTLANLPADSAFAVLEIGMNHPGEIAPLSRLARPDVAVITTVDAVHAEHFASEDEIADAKAEIFAGMGPLGVAVLNRDNRHFAHLRAAAERAGVGRVLAFGAAEDADVRLLEQSLQASGSAVTALVAGAPLSYCLPVPGAHWIANSLAVLAVLQALGTDLARGCAALAELTPPKGRGDRREVTLPDGAGFLLIDESYNASPPSMRAAFQVLGTARCERAGRRIAVLGDMLELGPEAPELHAALAEDLRAAGVDLVFACGPHMARLIWALPPRLVGGHAPDSAALAPRVAAAVRPGDAVMVKGSLGSRMAAVVEALAALEAPPLARAVGAG